MNKNLKTVIALIIVGAVGYLAGQQFGPASTPVVAAGESGEREVLYWVAPMDPNFKRSEPGKSPMGMDLTPVYADDEDGLPGTVKIDPAVVSSMGVRTAVAEFGPLSRRIDTVGYINYDEDTLVHVHTRVDGWIERLATRATGDRVKRGQLLFELYSPTRVNAQEEYLAALRSGNAVLKKASRDRLIALGITTGEITRLDGERKASKRVSVYAEADGVVAHLGVREGIFVTPATEVMSVAKLDRVWVIAEVFERQATWVEPGQKAIVSLDYLPGIELPGVVDYVYPELDPVTRTLKVRLRFENATESLRPNMFAKVLIQGRSTGDVVHVPRAAVIRGGTMNRVVVALGDGRFRSRQVTLGTESGDRVVIGNGLEAGESIVTSAQFLIDSESNIETDLARTGQYGDDE